MTDITHNSVNPQTDTSWYQHGWVWVVIAIPFTAVVFGIVMFVSANYQPDDLVVDDYYKVGKAINREIAFDKKAIEIGASAVLMSKTAEGMLFKVSGASDDLTLSVFHVTNSDEDLVIGLVQQGNGLYSAHSSALVERLSDQGVWYLEIRDRGHEWRLRSRLVTPLEDLSLQPNAGQQ